jgi:hypothetical protein
LFIGRFKNTAFCGRKQDESEKFLALTIFDFLVILKLRKETRAKFTEELIKNRGRYPRNFGTWLVNAFRLRNSAQYQLDPPKAKKVRRMINHAKEFIEIIDEVLSK